MFICDISIVESWVKTVAELFAIGVVVIGVVITAVAAHVRLQHLSKDFEKLSKSYYRLRDTVKRHQWYFEQWAEREEEPEDE